MSTNFFQRQDRARRNTTRLVVLFILAVVVLIGLSYFPVLLLYHVVSGRNKPTTTSQYQPQPKPSAPGKPASSPVVGPSPSRVEPSLWEPGVLIATAVGTLAIVGLGSAYKVSQLAGGGKSVALLLGGTEIPTNTRDLRERRVLNVVEEMSIASGVPVPPVFLLSEEQGINAFAAGYTTDDAVIAVSQGAIDYLTRDELQGVVAHEFSHILNGDMRLNIRLIGLIHGLIVLSLVGYYLMRLISEGTNRSSRSSQSNKGKGGGIIVALFLLGLALYILGSVGAFFGWLMQAAVSRQREYLADASAVQFTRNPEGIAGALKKIGGLEQGSRVENANASEVSHMFFANAIRSRFSSLFATHPPLEARIKAIDPNWDGVYPKVRKVVVESEPERPQDRSGRTRGFPGLPQLPLPIPVPHLAADATVARIGTVTDDSRATAAAFEEEMTPDIREVIGEPFSARAVVYALLLDPDPDVRVKQIQAFRAASDPRDIEEMLRFEERVRAIPTGTRLAVAHFAMPALRRLAPEQYKAFRVVMEGMIRADGRISLFEFCLQHLLTKGLDRAFGLQRQRQARLTKAGALREQVACVLGVLAWQGHNTPAAAAAAFNAGMNEWDAGQSIPLPEQTACSLDRFTAALDTLEESTPQLKQRLIRAAVVCIATDRAVTGLEYEILRTVCATLDCPFPPIGPMSR